MMTHRLITPVRMPATVSPSACITPSRQHTAAGSSLSIIGALHATQATQTRYDDSGLLTAFEVFKCKRTDGGGSPNKRTPLGSLRSGIGAAPKRVPPPSSSRTPARRAVHTPAQRSAADSSRDRAAAGSSRDGFTAGKATTLRDAQNGASSSPPGRKRDSAQLDSVRAADGPAHASKVKDVIAAHQVAGAARCRRCTRVHMDSTSRDCCSLSMQRRAILEDSDEEAAAAPLPDRRQLLVSESPVPETPFPGIDLTGNGAPTPAAATPIPIELTDSGMYGLRNASQLTPSLPQA